MLSWESIRRFLIMLFLYTNFKVFVVVSLSSFWKLVPYLNLNVRANPNSSFPVHTSGSETAWDALVNILLILNQPSPPWSYETLSWEYYHYWSRHCCWPRLYLATPTMLNMIGYFLSRVAFKGLLSVLGIHVISTLTHPNQWGLRCTAFYREVFQEEINHRHAKM